LGHLLFVVAGLLHISWLWGAVDATEMSLEIASSIEAPETLRAHMYWSRMGRWVADTEVGDELEVGCKSCTTAGTDIDTGDVGWHALRTEVTSGLVIELVDLVEITSKGGAVGEPFDAQGTLVDMWEVCLRVEGSLEGVVRPVSAVDTEIVVARSQELGLVHALDERGKQCGGWSSSSDRQMSAAFILARGLRW
jgi:hypothetical protein